MIAVDILLSQPQPLPTAAALQAVVVLLPPRSSVSALPLACAFLPVLENISLYNTLQNPMLANFVHKLRQISMA